MRGIGAYRSRHGASTTIRGAGSPTIQTFVLGCDGLIGGLLSLSVCAGLAYRLRHACPRRLSNRQTNRKVTGNASSPNNSNRSDHEDALVIGRPALVDRKFHVLI